MPEVTDYYSLLGISETAAPDEVKRAYRAVARTCHPDRNPGDAEAEERFKAVQRAYHVLSSPDRRRLYDLRMAGRGIDASVYRDRPAGGSLDPLVSLFFGDDPAVGVRSADAEAQVRLSFDQALRGGRTEVRLAGGETVPLVIPKGVRSGLKVRLRGWGRRGTTGERGDLYVTFRVDPVEQFRREGDNLHRVETVSAIEAIVGTTRSITNAYGQTMKVQIPPGTQPGERLRLRGQGVATETRTGDLFVEVRVTVPRALSDDQRAALAAAARQVGLL